LVSPCSLDLGQSRAARPAELGALQVGSSTVYAEHFLLGNFIILDRESLGLEGGIDEEAG
jgi:hypothetical protein